MSYNQGEIWLVNLEPTIGAEIQKLRPCLIVSDDTIGKLPLRTVVPITNWVDSFGSIPWMVKLLPDFQNNLAKSSSVDAFQIKNLSIKRFDKKIGEVNEEALFKIHAIIAKTLKIN
jgi:mRNA interferase MazF